MRKVQTTILLLLFCLLGSGLSLKGQSNAAQTFLLIDSTTALPLQDALVKSRTTFTFSNAVGQVRLNNIQEGDTLYISALGYKDTLLAYQNGIKKIALSPLRFALREVVVLGQRKNTAQQYLAQEVLSTTVSYKQMKALPAILSEPDILRPLANLPGVQSAQPGGSSLFVRGGDSYHNSMYIDGVPFYNMDHAFGFVSAVPTLSVQDLQFYREGLPAQYSSALSSVIAVRTVQPSLREMSGRISVGLGSIGAHYSVPLIKNKWAIGGGFRTANTGVIAPLASAIVNGGFINILSFGDFNVKSTYRINDQSYLEAFYFEGVNNVRKTPEFLEQEEGQTRSRIATLSYKTQKEKYYLSNQLFYSGYSFDLTSQVSESEDSDFFNYKYNTALHHVGSRNLVKFNYKGWALDLGADVNLLFNQQPGFVFNDSGATRSAGGEYNSLFNVALHGQGRYQIGPKWQATLGLRAEILPQLNDQALQLLPKAMLQYTPNNRWAWFLAYDRNSTFVHRYRATYDASPADLPFLASGESPASTMDQISLGLVYTQAWFSWNSTAYYRNFNNVLDRDYLETGNIYSFGVGFNPLTNLSQGIEVVQGQSYGIENRAQIKLGITRLDLAYTYSQANRQANNLNQGQAYPFEFNRAHTLTGIFVLRFKKNKINKITEFSLSYNYGSGNFTQFALQQQLNPFGSQRNPYIGQRNNAQLPPVQHLDVSFNFIKEKERGKRIFTLSVFNATLNRNIFRYSEVAFPGGNLELRGEGTLPIFPSFSYAYFF